jgi:hypothetical protein
LRHRPWVIPGVVLSLATIVGGGTAASVTRSSGCVTWVSGRAPESHDSEFVGVAAISPSDIWAVGNNEGAGPLIEHWDGSRWSISLLRLDANEAFGGVAAVAADDVWAVGLNDLRVLTAHWDGSKWTEVPAPDPSDEDNLSAVVALASDDVWAGGDDRYTDGSVQPLWLHWDGTSWTHVTQVVLPNGGLISSMTAVSPTDIWAAGYQGQPQGIGNIPLVEHWDGTSWRPIRYAPADLGGQDIFTSIWAISSDDVWVVGYHEVHRSLVQHWDGTRWSNVSAPWAGVMTGVWGAASDDVWAVGRYIGQTGWLLADSEHWDGTSWTRVQTPQPGQSSVPHAITGTSSTDIWAVGYANWGQDVPWTLHSHGICP